MHLPGPGHPDPDGKGPDQSFCPANPGYYGGFCKGSRLFIAMKNADGDELKAAFTDSAILQTIFTDKDGKTGVHNYPVADFAGAISRLPNGAADERIQFDMVRIDGPLAIVWAPYRFYYNGKLTHCGIDSFQLLRVGGVWKILYIVDTRRKDCE